MIDRRDPEKLGAAYLRLRQHGLSIAEAVNCPADDYKDQPAHLRYPRVEVTVTTSYQRTPIEKLAAV